MRGAQRECRCGRSSTLLPTSRQPCASALLSPCRASTPTMSFVSVAPPFALKSHHARALPSRTHSPPRLPTSLNRGLAAPRLWRRHFLTMSAAAERTATRWLIDSYGEIANLNKQSFRVAPPSPDQVRIQVRAVGMNFADVFAVLGLYELAGPAPLTPGFEVSGVVEAVGSDVTAVAPGDKVFALTRFNGYATLINIQSVYVQRLPPDWSFAEGAAYPAQAFTAWYAVCVLGALPSTGARPVHVTSDRKVVLVHSAAGGVGLNLVEIVRRIGGEIVCTVGSEQKARVLLERGVTRERIIVRGVDDVDGFEKVVRERALGGAGVDVVVDSVMGDYFEPGYNLLNAGGRHILMGSASLMPKSGLNLLRGGVLSLIKLGWKFLNRPKLDLVKAISENKTVAAFNLGGIFTEVTLMETGFRELREMNLPKPTVGRTFPFDEAHEALKFFQTGKSVGKLVLLVDEKD